MSTKDVISVESEYTVVVEQDNITVTEIEGGDQINVTEVSSSVLFTQLWQRISTELSPINTNDSLKILNTVTIEGYQDATQFSVKGFSTQTSDIVLIQDSSDTKIVSINDNGQQMATGARVNEFSTDETLAGNSDTALVTEKAIKIYSDTKIGGSGTTGKIPKYSGSKTLTDSIISESSGIITIAGSAKMSTGATVNEFSTDGTLTDDSDIALVTEKAIKTYSDTKYTGTGTTNTLTKFTGAKSLGDSIVSESGTVLTCAGAVNINGQDDASQLVVKANSIQTEPLFLAQDSIGAELFRLNSNDSTNLFTSSTDDITSANNCLGIGSGSLSSLTSGSFNVALGTDSLGSVTTGGSNMSIGRASGNMLTTGGFNVFIGDNAGNEQTTQSFNVFIGDGAGRVSSVFSSENVAIGQRAGEYLQHAGNTYVGASSGKFATDAKWNACFGYQTMYGFTGVTTGDGNAMLGFQAGRSIRDGGFNVLIGYQAGYGYVSESNKLIIENSSDIVTPLIYGEFDNDIVTISGQLNVEGQNDVSQLVLKNNATQTEPIVLCKDSINAELFRVFSDGDSNLGFGASVFLGLTSGTENIFFGTNSGFNNSSGSTNTGIGVNSLLSNTTGSGNFALGSNSLRSNTTAVNSVAIGVSALRNSNANANVAIGAGAMFTNSTGANNIAIGANSLDVGSTPSLNIAIGNTALKSNNSSQNVAIGYNCGRTVTGNSNVFIGYDVASTQTAISNQLWIDNSNTSTPLIYGEFDNEVVTISGQLNIEGQNDVSQLVVKENDTQTNDTILVNDSSDTQISSINGSGLQMATGARVNEFSTDGTLADDSDTALVTEKAIKTYVDRGVAEVVSQVAHGLAVQDAIYYDGSDWQKADASAVTTLGTSLVSAVADVDNFTVTHMGLVTGLSGLDVGEWYYVSDSTPGLLTLTESTTYSNPILIAISTTSGIVMPYRAQDIGGPSVDTTRSDYDSTNLNYLYTGSAAPGSSEADPVWRISRYDFSTGELYYADGDELYNNIYDNRESLSYS